MAADSNVVTPSIPILSRQRWREFGNRPVKDFGQMILPRKANIYGTIVIGGFDVKEPTMQYPAGTVHTPVELSENTTELLVHDKPAPKKLTMPKLPVLGPLIPITHGSPLNVTPLQGAFPEMVALMILGSFLTPPPATPVVAFIFTLHLNLPPEAGYNVIVPLRRDDVSGGANEYALAISGAPASATNPHAATATRVLKAPFMLLSSPQNCPPTRRTGRRKRIAKTYHLRPKLCSQFPEHDPINSGDSALIDTSSALPHALGLWPAWRVS
jgi:hypothetical protein